MAHHHTPAVLLGQLAPERQGQYKYAVCSHMHARTQTQTHVPPSVHQIHTKSTHALMASVTEPIWLTFSSRQLQAFSSTARCILRGLVTVRSSPTTCNKVTDRLLLLSPGSINFCTEIYKRGTPLILHMKISLHYKLWVWSLVTPAFTRPGESMKYAIEFHYGLPNPAFCSHISN